MKAIKLRYWIDVGIREEFNVNGIVTLTIMGPSRKGLFEFSG